MNSLKSTFNTILCLVTTGSLYLAWSQHEELQQIKRNQDAQLASQTLSVETAVAESVPPSVDLSASKQIESPI